MKKMLKASILVGMLMTNISYASSGVLYDKVDRSHTCYGDPTVEHYEKVDPYKKKPNEITKVDYSQPKRHYHKLDADYPIYVETSLQKDKVLYKKSTEKLIKKLAEVEALLPKKAFKQLKTVPIYLMHGETAPMGGLARGMSYYRKGAPNYTKTIDSRWEHVIVINSATNYVALGKVWSIKALVHEYAHAWHLSNFPEKHLPMKRAYQAAKDNQRYRDVKNNKGYMKKSVYAMTNHLEYFAELSAMYFTTVDYCPFNRQLLKSFDKKGFDMVEKVWGIAD